MATEVVNRLVFSDPDATYSAREGNVSSNLHSWCPSLQKFNHSNSTVLFCFPFAGGGASAFGNWAVTFGDRITICPIQYPGRETRWSEPEFEKLSALVDDLADAFENYWPSRFAFLGHSFGALVAFELARTLMRRGQPTPMRLFLAGARAPHLLIKEKAHRLSDQDFLDRLRQFNGLPKELLEHHDLIASVLPIIKNDFRLFEEHEFKSGNPLAVPLSVFGGLEDLNVSIGDLLGWSIHTSKVFRSRFLKGHHFFLFSSLPAIATYIKEDLDACSPRDGG
jgi:surfactin synthase thioesterase subunit